MSDEEIEKKSILIVEDDPLMIVFIKGVLQPFGYNVFNVTNGKSCVLALARYQFDLIIMDINMPIYDGTSATIDIRNNREIRQTPIIAISASEEVRENALYGGADHFFLKPISKDDLLDKVSELIYEYEHKELK